MEAASGPPESERPYPLVIRTNIKWKLFLDRKQEKVPHLHVYLSTPFSGQVIEFDLLDSDEGSMRFVVRFERNGILEKTSVQDLLHSCDLNVDVYVHTKNQYKEAITNPAGSCIFPLHEIVKELGPNGSGFVEKPAVLFMIHDDNKRIKGTLTIERIVVSKTTGTAIPAVVLNQKVVTENAVKDGSIREIIARNEKMQHICGRYIEASEVLYENVDPTIESVSNINSAIWVSRAGIFPPIFYTLDVYKTVITEEFYLNCMDIVLKRLGLTTDQLLALEPFANEKDNKTMGSICGQLLCCYIVHCTYRTDYAIVFDRETKTFEYVPTENFGDVSVDLGAGDCEDFAKMIIRIYLGLMRLHKVTKHPELQKCISFLKCYYPFLVLLGVSSAQINAAPKDIVNMGAHENAMLTPLQQFMDELCRFNPDAIKWKEQIMNDPEQRSFWEQSKRCKDLVLEGTGILEPTMSKELSVKTRIVLESFMEEDVYYALRREYHYDEKNTSFYKTVEKMFCPVPILEGGSFGSFLIMQKNDNGGKLRKKLTKSVSFSDFIADSKNVAIFMEPELTDAEKVAAFEGLKNLHPPVPLDAPEKTKGHERARKREICEEVISKMMAQLKPRMQSNFFGLKVSKQTYFLRSGKTNPSTATGIVQFLTSLPTGMFLTMEVFEEWITDDVGGYRLVVHTNEDVIMKHWRKNEAEFSKKLPKN